MCTTISPVFDSSLGWGPDGILFRTEIGSRMVNVGPIPAIALGGPGETMIDFAGLEARLEQAGRAVLQESTEVFAGVDCPVTPVYRRGDPAAEILKAAQEAKAELIVMGSRGLGRIGDLFLGSVSERALHAAYIPVLIAR